MPATAKTRSAIVLITVQGLLRITNRAGKSVFVFLTQRTLSAKYIALLRATLKDFFKKYFPVSTAQTCIQPWPAF